MIPQFSITVPNLGAVAVLVISNVIYQFIIIFAYISNMVDEDKRKKQERDGRYYRYNIPISRSSISGQSSTVSKSSSKTPMVTGLSFNEPCLLLL